MPSSQRLECSWNSTTVRKLRHSSSRACNLLRNAVDGVEFVEFRVETTAREFRGSLPSMVVNIAIERRQFVAHQNECLYGEFAPSNTHSKIGKPLDSTSGRSHPPLDKILPA